MEKRTGKSRNSHGGDVWRYSQFVLVLGTSVGFTPAPVRRNFTLEQFWGRAVRASHDSNESLGRFLFAANSG